MQANSRNYQNESCSYCIQMSPGASVCMCDQAEHSVRVYAAISEQHCQERCHKLGNNSAEIQHRFLCGTFADFLVWFSTVPGSFTSTWLFFTANLKSHPKKTDKLDCVSASLLLTLTDSTEHLQSSTITENRSHSNRMSGKWVHSQSVQRVLNYCPLFFFSYLKTLSIPLLLVSSLKK